MEPRDRAEPKRETEAVVNLRREMIDRVEISLSMDMSESSSGS